MQDPQELAARRFGAPDKTTTLGVGCTARLIRIGGATIKRIEHAPGWRWSERNGPLVGASRCQARHLGYVLTGRLGVRLVDDRTAEFRAGDVFVVPPDHDAWTIGADPCVTLELTGAVSTSA